MVYCIGGSEEKIKIKNWFYFKYLIGFYMWINMDLWLYIYVDMLFFFLLELLGICCYIYVLICYIYRY